MTLGDDQPGRGNATAYPGGNGGATPDARGRRQRPLVGFLGLIAMLAFCGWVLDQLATAPVLTPEVALLWILVGVTTFSFVVLFVLAVAVTVGRARKRD